jgi:hypothetical protein
MHPIKLSFCRKAAAKCRKRALSATSPEEWIFMAEKWEWLADISEEPLPSSPLKTPDQSESTRLI